MTPPIKLYTNPACPWAQRAEIILAELKIPHEVEIIDLATPRTAEYLKINPRGLVPSLSYGEEIITESGIVTQFLADLSPSHVLPASTDPHAALKRARIAFFVDTYISKVQFPWFSKLYYPKPSDGPQEAIVTGLIEGIAKEVEPLLTDAAPFFGGSDKITLAEVLTGSFVCRMYSFPKHGLTPDFIALLETKTPNFHRWAKAVVEQPAVKATYAEDKTVAGVKRKRAALAAAAK